jgi:GntR family transcriptional regulator, sialic acid-inducible nan operon repressor
VEDAAISKKKLGDLVEERLLALLQGGLAPGDQLPSERELMEQYKVGRPAIREAMQSLERKGLIEIRHGERPRVAPPSFDRTLTELAESVRHLLLHLEGSLDHLKEARLMFEAAMARRAAERRTEADVASITQALARQKASKPGTEDFLRCDGEFHHAIARVSGNPLLAELSRYLFGWLSEFHVEQVRKPGLENLTIAEHEAILEAIRKGAGDEAAQQMVNHLSRANALYRLGPQGG